MCRRFYDLAAPAVNPLVSRASDGACPDVDTCGIETQYFCEAHNQHARPVIAVQERIEDPKQERPGETYPDLAIFVRAPTAVGSPTRPVITSISPTSGRPGDIITISGRGFGATPGKVIFTPIGGGVEALVV